MFSCDDGECKGTTNPCNCQTQLYVLQHQIKKRNDVGVRDCAKVQQIKLLFPYLFMFCNTKAKKVESRQPLATVNSQPSTLNSHPLHTSSSTPTHSAWHPPPPGGVRGGSPPSLRMASSPLGGVRGGFPSHSAWHPPPWGGELEGAYSAPHPPPWGS